MSPFLARILKEQVMDPSSSTAGILVSQNFEKWRPFSHFSALLVYLYIYYKFFQV